MATLIGTVLVMEVLPGLDRIHKSIEAMHRDISFAVMAVCEIDSIYEHLQDCAPDKASESRSVGSGCSGSTECRGPLIP